MLSWFQGLSFLIARCGGGHAECLEAGVLSTRTPYRWVACNTAPEQPLILVVPRLYSVVTSLKFEGSAGMDVASPSPHRAFFGLAVELSLLGTGRAMWSFHQPQ